MQTNVILFPNKPKTKEADLTPPAAPRLTDFTSFLPQGTEQILIELSSGTHNIPHKLYEFMFKATESKVELVVFACLVRFTMGFHRSKCRASQSYICEWTGLGSSGVRRGLKTLIRKGLICVDKEASFEAMCSIYELPVVKWYLEFGCLDARKPAEPEKDPKKSYPQGNPPSTEGTENPCPKQAPPSGQNEQRKDQNEHGLEQDRQARPSNLDSKKETLTKI
jgi:hypothetical protein